MASLGFTRRASQVQMPARNPNQARSSLTINERHLIRVLTQPPSSTFSLWITAHSEGINLSSFGEELLISTASSASHLMITSHSSGIDLLSFENHSPFKRNHPRLISIYG
ncbi:uncharacterized protein FA14DRAFT_182700 [Meira miltonrushii]|uniref:Uncharacterized protein n=1 Tax=Meira miltonrushii TaxID=1280837 RepID=A0A316V1Q2_9BASI|nr:uncharacterized protein FA14DRAFT_182700 [Meira miltonrushii]PWN31480.1 hypothetical protein FA14DRAFT_182700 [Meira miltonrushii]